MNNRFRPRLTRWLKFSAAALIAGSVLLPTTGWTGTIQGHVFADWNENGVKDPWETGMANELIRLLGTFDTTSNLSVNTNSNGFYSMTATGTFSLQPAKMIDFSLGDWLQTTPERFDTAIDGYYFGYGITIGTSETRTVNIGLVDPAAPVNTPPTLNMSQTSYTVEVGDTRTFSGDFTDPDVGDLHFHAWNLSNGATVEMQSLTYTFNQIGTQNLTYTVTDSRGASDSINITVSVTNKLPEVTISSSANEVPVATAVNFNTSVVDTAGETHTYQWDFGDGNTANTPNPSHTYMTGGAFIARLTVTDNNGGSTTVQYTIAVNNSTPVIIIGPNQTVEIGQPVTLTATVIDPELGPTPTYEWTVPGQSTINTLNGGDVTFDTKGRFRVTLTVTDSYGAVGTNSFEVTVTGATPMVIIEGASAIGVNRGEMVDFTATFSDADGGTHNYVWTFGDGATATGVATSDRLSTSHQFRVPASSEGLTTTLAVTDDEGNVGQAQVTVNIRGRDSDPCTPGIATIRSNRNGAWTSASTWTPNRVPNRRDWISVSHLVILNDNPRTNLNEAPVLGQGLCVETTGILRGAPGSLDDNTPWVDIYVGMLHNKGTIRAENGFNGSGPFNQRTGYTHGTAGGNIRMIVSEFHNAATGKVIAGRGGDDLIYNYFSTGWGTRHQNAGGIFGLIMRNSISVNAKSGDGGLTMTEALTFNNAGIVQSGHAGFASTHNRVRPEWGVSMPDQSQTLRQFSSATGGQGGQLNALANNVARGERDSINTATFASGNGGDAVFFSPSGGSAGNGGDIRVDVSRQFGEIIAGTRGRYARWDPAILESNSDTRVAGSQEVVIFGGDNAYLDLRNLALGAINAEKTITIAVGEGGEVDLTGVSDAVFDASEQVEIFADTLTLSDGVMLENLTNAPTITAAASKILYDVTLFGRNRLVGQPAETITLSVEVINGSPSADIFDLSLSDTAGWAVGTIPTTVAINPLQRSRLNFDVTLPDALGADNTLTLTATSQGDTKVQDTLSIYVQVVSAEIPPPPPRGDDMADIVVAVESSILMSSQLHNISAVLEAMLPRLRGDDPAAVELEAFMELHNDNPPEAELMTFLEYLNEKYPPDPNPLAKFPMVELLTFTDTVSSQIVSKDMGAVVMTLRSLDFWSNVACNNVSITALEQALTYLKPNGTVIFAVTSPPDKAAGEVIAQAQQQGIKVNIILIDGCERSTADTETYQVITEETGGSIGDTPDVEKLVEIIEEGFDPFIEEIPNRYTASGTVRDAQDQPLAEVNIQIGETTTTSDVNGEWEINFLVEAEYTVTATKEGYAIAGQTFTLNADTNLDLVAEKLPNRYTASGTVRDAQGQPVTGVTIQIGEAITTTDANGAWEITGLIEGDYTMTASKDGYTIEAQTFTLEADTTLDLVAIQQPPQGIAGGVIQDAQGNPVAGVNVTIDGQTTVTDDNGRWEISNVNEGKHDITASKDGYVFPTKACEVGNDENCEISLQAGSLLTVEVITEPRRPLQGELINYTITLTNQGDMAATNLVLTMPLPDNTTLESLTVPEGMTCDALTCQFAILESGSQVQLQLTLANQATTKVLRHNFSVASNEYPTDTLQKRTAITPYFSVERLSRPPQVTQGDHFSLSYRFAVNAYAPAAADGVQFKTELPRGYSVQNVSGATCNLEALPALTCELGALGVGDSQDVQLDLSLDDFYALWASVRVVAKAANYPTDSAAIPIKVYLGDAQVDIVVAIDVSGSMHDEVDALEAVLAQLEITLADQPQAQPMIAVVSFRDDVYLEIATTHLDEVRAAVAELTPAGGGACPEASYAALELAVEHVRDAGTVLLVTDAPPYAEVDMTALIMAINQKNLDLVVIQPQTMCAPLDAWDFQ